jgi:hypothetical protein
MHQKRSDKTFKYIQTGMVSLSHECISVGGVNGDDVSSFPKHVSALGKLIHCVRVVVPGDDGEVEYDLATRREYSGKPGITKDETKRVKTKTIYF